MVPKHHKVVDLRNRAGMRSRFVRPRGAPAEPASPRMPLRARRRRVRAALAFLAALALGGAVFGMGSLSYLPRLSVNDVAVEGAKDVPARLVRAYVETALYDGANHLLSRTNIFLYPRSEIAQSVASEFPRIRSAEVSRAGLLAQAVTVAVVERQPSALWCGDGGDCYFIDEDGFIFAHASTTPAMPVFRGAIAALPSQSGQATTTPIGGTFLPEHFKGILALFDRLRQAGYTPLGATAEDGQDFSVAFSDGFLMRASFGSDAGALVKNLQLAFSSDPLKGKASALDYIDLRFGDRVYYKFKGGARGAASSARQ